MKKKKLDILYSYDFELLGVTTVVKGYRLAWELNNHLSMNLKKQNDLMITEGEQTLSYSYFLDEAAFNVVRIFKNKSNESDQNRHFIVPEHNHFDFIIMIQGEAHVSKRLHKELKTIASIELVAFIPLESLKSKDHFIF